MYYQFKLISENVCISSNELMFSSLIYCSCNRPGRRVISSSVSRDKRLQIINKRLTRSTWIAFKTLSCVKMVSMEAARDNTYF